MTGSQTRSCNLWMQILAFSLSGCATIVSGGRNQVTVDNSGGATYFSVLDHNNHVVDSGVTPKQVTLRTKQTWLKPAKYHVVYAGQEGTTQHDLNARLNWWTAGNIVIGGVPGLVIDAATGAVWKLQPKVVGQIPAQQIVSSESQGAEMVAVHSGSQPATTGRYESGNLPDHVRRASFENSDRAPARLRSENPGTDARF